MNDLFDYALRNVDDSDMVGVTINNEVNFLDKAIGIIFRRKDQLSEEVIWSVFSKAAQSNARYNAMGRLIGRKSIILKGRPIDVMVHLKKVSSRLNLKQTAWPTR